MGTAEEVLTDEAEKEDEEERQRETERGIRFTSLRYRRAVEVLKLSLFGDGRTANRRANHRLSRPWPRPRFPPINHDAHIDPSSLKQSLDNVRAANRAGLIRKIDGDGRSTRIALPAAGPVQPEPGEGPDSGPEQDGLGDFGPSRRVRLTSASLAGSQAGGAQPLKKEWEIRGGSASAELTQPWLHCLSRTSPSELTGVEALSAEIAAFARYMAPSDEERAAADHTIAALRQTVHMANPDLGLELIGSRASGLAMPLSDVDFNLLDHEARLDDILDRAQALKTLRRLERRLRRNRQLDNVLLVKRARIPIIRGTYRPSSIDFQIQHTTNAFNSTHYVRAYLRQYPTLRSLFLVLRHVLLMRGLSDGAKQGLSSYPLFNAILASVKFDEQQSRPSDAGSQLLSFLQLYADIDFAATGISVEPVALLPIGQSGAASTSASGAGEQHADAARARPAFPNAMYLRDPADPSNDLGRNCGLIRQIQAQFYAMKRELDSRIERWRSDATEEALPRPLLQALVGDYSTFELDRAWVKRMGSSYGDAAKALLKFPQMDFEMAVWEMTQLLIAPKKVFKSIYYHKQTRNTWHRPDPSFTYLLSFFLLLTSFAWSLAYTPAFSSVVKLAAMFVAVHFLAGSLAMSVIGYFVVGRLLGPGVAGLPGRRRQQGLFGTAGATAGAEALEFGYCFDVSIRAFFPPYVLLYIVQYILMPAINHSNRVSTFVANLLYLAAGIYWSLIIFLGYNALHFLQHTQLLLLPIVAWFIIWLVCTIAGINLEISKAKPLRMRAHWSFSPTGAKTPANMPLMLARGGRGCWIALPSCVKRRPRPRILALSPNHGSGYSGHCLQANQPAPPKPTFLDDSTPIEASEAHDQEDAGNPDDLSFLSAHAPRASMVESMALALDAFSSTPHADPLFMMRSNSYESATPSRSRGHTFSSSLSSDMEMRDPHALPAFGSHHTARPTRRDSAMYRRNLQRLPSIFGEDEDSVRARVYDAQRAQHPALAMRPRKNTRNSGKSSAGSNSSSIDLGHLANFKGRLGPAGNRRSRSFDLGMQSRPVRPLTTPDNGDVAPTPVIFSGPEAQRSPTRNNGAPLAPPPPLLISPPMPRSHRDPDSLGASSALQGTLLPILTRLSWPPDQARPGQLAASNREHQQAAAAVVNKKPSSFFRRRKKSASNNAPVPLPLVLNPARFNPQPGEPSPVSSLRAFMDPYLASEAGVGPAHANPATRDDANLGLFASAPHGHTTGQSSREQVSREQVSRSRVIDAIAHPHHPGPHTTTRDHNHPAPASTSASTLRIPHLDSFLADSSSTDEPARRSPVAQSSTLSDYDAAECRNRFDSASLKAASSTGLESGRPSLTARQDSWVEAVAVTPTSIGPSGARNSRPEPMRLSSKASVSDLSDYRSAPSTPLLPETTARKIYDNADDTLDHAAAAAWLGDAGPDRERVRVAFLQLFDFANLAILASLRNLCARIVLRGESQQMDRLLDTFAKRWCECNSSHGFRSSDVVHTICYSILLLNTDLHLADIGQKMTKNQFVRNTMLTIKAVVVDDHSAASRLSTAGAGAPSSPTPSRDERRERAWDLQVENVLRSSYSSIAQEPLPLFGSHDASTTMSTGSNFLSLGGGANTLRRTPSTVSKAQSETQRGRLGLDAKSLGTRWMGKARSRPRLPSAATGLSSSRTSLDGGSSGWSPSMSSTWSKNSLGKTLTSASLHSFDTEVTHQDYQSSIGFANALSQAIIRDDQMEMSHDELKSAPLLEDESLELHGAPWAKEGILRHKCHLEGVEKRSKDRNWNDCFAVVEKGWMRLFSFSMTAKSLRNKARSQKAGGVVGGGNWQDNAEEVWKFMLRHAIASSLPPPGYSKSRPYVWALSLPTGAVHLFSVGTPDIVKEFVSTVNFWSARLSKEPMMGGVSNMEYGWSDMIVNRALVGGGADSASRTQLSMRSSTDTGTSAKARLAGDRAYINEWQPPQQSMMASQLLEVDQLKALQAYVNAVEEELQKHNEMRGPMLLAFSAKHPNAAKALTNWEKRSSYLLREIVKFRTYIDALQNAQGTKDKIYKMREEEEASRRANGESVVA
ncbi:hypothetical protein DV737_g809, partial [Chaetothyriales sp. CBS 132003]